MKSFAVKLMLIKYLPLLILTVFLSSCAPIKAYPGPELPREMISLFELGSRSPHNIDVQVTANGTRVGRSGVAVKPGVVGIGGEISIGSGKYRNCTCSMTLDYNALSECEKQPNAYCSRCAYTTGSEYCEEEFEKYLCRLEFKSAPGGEYLISFDNRSMIVIDSNKHQTMIPCEKGDYYWKNTMVTSYISGAIHVMKDGKLCQSGC